MKHARGSFGLKNVTETLEVYKDVMIVKSTEEKLHDRNLTSVFRKV